MIYARNTRKQKFHVIERSRAICNAPIRPDALYTKALREREALCVNCARLIEDDLKATPCNESICS